MSLPPNTLSTMAPVSAKSTNPTAPTVFTDGACIGNPGPGGWAWAVADGPFASGSAPSTTNNRMEMTAALEALRAVEGDVLVMSDSTYVVHAFEKSWVFGWEAKGWRKKGGDVPNADLWRSLLAEYRKPHRKVIFEWVRGHSGDPMNDVVDRLATEAAETQESRSGSEPPTTLGPADEPFRRTRAVATATTDTGLPDGWHLVVLGHRPPELGGYSPDNPTATEVRRKIVEILAGLLVVHSDLMVVSGLNLGAEQIGVEAAVDAGVPFAAVLAYPDMDAVWPFDTQRRFRRLLGAAAVSIVLSPKKPTSKQAAGLAIGVRNKWLVDRADAAIVVSNRTDRDLASQIVALEGRIPDEVWVVDP